MGPKKEVKSAGEELPKEVEPELPPFETVGYGRFQHLNGVSYEGNWKLIKGIKVKEGYGRLILPVELQNGIGQEYYEGDWVEDRMEGFGTYCYPDGSAYSGLWLNNKHEGMGIFNFADGTVYEGVWKDHLMHGCGSFIDHLGRKWEGQFRQGVFESRKQMELSKEKIQEKRKSEIKQQIRRTIDNIVQILQKEQRPVQKINHFFASSEHVKQLIKGDLAHFTSKEKEDWLETFQLAQGGQFTILEHSVDCKTISSQRILARQQQGVGQVAEVFFSKAGKKISLLFLEIFKSKWIVAAASEEPK